MKREKLEVVRGSGNVFRDLKHKNANAEQFKAILAEIIKAVDRERLSVRAAHRRTGMRRRTFPASLTRTSPSRLTVMAIINLLGSAGPSGCGSAGGATTSGSTVGEWAVA